MIIVSDHPADVIAGARVTFPSASTHVLTASYAGLSTTLSITVIPAAITQPAGLANTGLDPRAPLGLATLLLALSAGATALSRRRTKAPVEAVEL